MGNIDINVKDLDVDFYLCQLISFTVPKEWGPYTLKGTRVDSILHGGAQEKNRRPGTENVPGIVGMAAAIKLAYDNIEQNIKHLQNLSDRLIDKVMDKIPYVRLNGDREQRLPGNVNLSFEFIEGESLLLMLDMKGVQASSGSACTSGSLDPSHVLLAIGLSHEIAHGSLRISFGTENTEEDVDYIVDNLEEIVSKLRAMSPLYEDYVRKDGK